MRHHPLVTWVNIIGTALAIFLLMVIVEINAVKVEPFRPESNRDRMLHARVLGFTWDESGQERQNNGQINYSTIQRLYNDIPGVETTSAYMMWLSEASVSLPNQTPITANYRSVDHEYFKVFDLKFIEGAPFDESVLGVSPPVIVISETVARRIFGTTDVVGKQLQINYSPRTIVGVVEDVSSFATNAYSDIWGSIGSGTYEGSYSHILGNFSATILAESRADFPRIRREIERRYSALETEMKELGYTSLITRGQPFDQEELEVGGLWNNNIDEVRMLRYMLYALFLIIPAINIGSMTSSRMRQRMTDMAVMRSYGCTRWGLMRSILIENLIVTLCAGVIGLAGVIGFGMIAPDYMFNDGGLSYNNPTVNLSILFHWSTFFMAIGFCFILNLLSTGLPAWKASRLNIVNSLRGSN